MISCFIDKSGSDGSSPHGLRSFIQDLVTHTRQQLDSQGRKEDVCRSQESK